MGVVMKNEYLKQLYIEICKDKKFALERDCSICLLNDKYEIYCTPCLDKDNGISIQINDNNECDFFYYIELNYCLTFNLYDDLKNYHEIMNEFINLLSFVKRWGYYEN
jgi:hypothetical protein